MTESSSVWWVYILRCADDSLYTGVTNDPDGRLTTHNAGKGARYTRARLPVEMVWKERAADRSAAQSREWAIKQLGRRDKLALIKDSPASAGN